MAKISDRYYFDCFVKCADYACQAARLLKDVLAHFDTETLPDKLIEMHVIEHNADTCKHEMMTELIKAFITPIERDSISELSHHIDNVTDRLEDVLIRLYTNNIRSVRPDAIEFADVIISCCDATKEALVEFIDFKKSKKIYEQIVAIHNLEEQGDKRFLNCMRRLHTECTDLLEIIGWREVFVYMERCADSCEHVADVMANVIMENI